MVKNPFNRIEENFQLLSSIFSHFEHFENPEVQEKICCRRMQTFRNFQHPLSIPLYKKQIILVQKESTKIWGPVLWNTFLYFFFVHFDLWSLLINLNFDVHKNPLPSSKLKDDISDGPNSDKMLDPELKSDTFATSIKQEISIQKK